MKSRFALVGAVGGRSRRARPAGLSFMQSRPAATGRTQNRCDRYVRGPLLQITWNSRSALPIRSADDENTLRVTHPLVKKASAWTSHLARNASFRPQEILTFVFTKHN